MKKILIFGIIIASAAFSTNCKKDDGVNPITINDDTADTTSTDTIYTDTEPVAVVDSIIAFAGETVCINVLDNDYDLDGDTLQFHNAQAFSAQIFGELTYEEDGEVCYTPYTSAPMSQFLAYSNISDDDGNIAVGNIILQTRRKDSLLNNAPKPMNDTLVSHVNIRLDIDVSANDVEPDGDDWYIYLNHGEFNCTTTLNDDGTVHYIPDEDFYGMTSFTYTMSDYSKETTVAVFVEIQ